MLIFHYFPASAVDGRPHVRASGDFVLQDHQREAIVRRRTGHASLRRHREATRSGSPLLFSRNGMSAGKPHSFWRIGLVPAEVKCQPPSRDVRVIKKEDAASLPQTARTSKTQCGSV